jgi:hypothetical protein
MGRSDARTSIAVPHARRSVVSQRKSVPGNVARIIVRRVVTVLRNDHAGTFARKNVMGMETVQRNVPA